MEVVITEAQSLGGIAVAKHGSKTVVTRAAGDCMRNKRCHGRNGNARNGPCLASINREHRRMLDPLSGAKCSGEVGVGIGKPDHDVGPVLRVDTGRAVLTFHCGAPAIFPSVMARAIHGLSIPFAGRRVLGICRHESPRTCIGDRPRGCKVSISMVLSSGIEGGTALTASRCAFRG